MSQTNNPYVVRPTNHTTRMDKSHLWMVMVMVTPKSSLNHYNPHHNPLLGYPLSQNIYALFHVVEHTKMLTYNVPMNHIERPSSQYNHPDTLLITYITNTTKNSHHHITIQKVRTCMDIKGNDEVDMLAKQGAQALHVIVAPLYLISHQTPYWPGIPSTST